MFETELLMHYEGETPWNKTHWEWGDEVNNEENNKNQEENNPEPANEGENSDEYLENLDQIHDELQALALQMIDAEMTNGSHV